MSELSELREGVATLTRATTTLTSSVVSSINDLDSRLDALEASSGGGDNPTLSQLASLLPRNDELLIGRGDRWTTKSIDSFLQPLNQELVEISQRMVDLEASSGGAANPNLNAIASLQPQTDRFMVGVNDQWGARPLAQKDIDPFLGAIAQRVTTLEASSGGATNPNLNAIASLQPQTDRFMVGVNNQWGARALAQKDIDPFLGAIAQRVTTLEASSGGATNPNLNAIASLQPQTDRFMVGVNNQWGARPLAQKDIDPFLGAIAQRVTTLEASTGGETNPNLSAIASLQPQTDRFMVGVNNQWGARALAQKDIDPFLGAIAQRVTTLEASAGSSTSRLERWSTRPSNLGFADAGRTGYNTNTQRLEQWTGSTWEDLPMTPPKLSSRPQNPAEGAFFYNDTTNSMEYYNGTQFVGLTLDGTTSTQPNTSWTTATTATGNRTINTNEYLLLNPDSGSFELMLPGNPAVGTTVNFRGIGTSSNIIFVNPNGKKFQGVDGRRTYSGTAPVTVTYISEQEGWMPSASIPQEIIVVQPPASTSLWMWLQASLGVFKNPQNQVTLWSGDINSNPFELSETHTDGLTFYRPDFVANALNNKPAVKFPTGKGLRDTSTPTPPRQYTLFLVASVDNAGAGRPSAFLREGKHVAENGWNTAAQGFLFSSWGIHQLPFSSGQSYPPGFNLLIPDNRRPSSNTFAVYVYQIDLDTRFCRLFDNSGSLISIGQYFTIPIESPRCIIMGNDTGGYGLQLDLFGNMSPIPGYSYEGFSLAEARFYNGLLNSAQIKAVSDALIGTYAISFRF